MEAGKLFHTDLLKESLNALAVTVPRVWDNSNSHYNNFLGVVMLCKSHCTFHEHLSDFLHFEILVASHIILVQLRTVETCPKSNGKMSFVS